jgi:hypothetical protein
MQLEGTVKASATLASKIAAGEDGGSRDARPGPRELLRALACRWVSNSDSGGAGGFGYRSPGRP